MKRPETDTVQKTPKECCKISKVNVSKLLEMRFCKGRTLKEANFSLAVYRRKRNVTIRWLEDETDETLKTLVKGDMIWLETPQNPRGEVADLLTRVAVGACDATFAPPPIQCLLSAAKCQLLERSFESIHSANHIAKELELSSTIARQGWHSPRQMFNRNSPGEDRGKAS